MDEKRLLDICQNSFTEAFHNFFKYFNIKPKYALVVITKIEWKSDRLGGVGARALITSSPSYIIKNIPIARIQLSVFLGSKTQNTLLKLSIGEDTFYNNINKILINCAKHEASEISYHLERNELTKGSSHKIIRELFGEFFRVGMDKRLFFIHEPKNISLDGINLGSLDRVKRDLELLEKDQMRKVSPLIRKLLFKSSKKYVESLLRRAIHSQSDYIYIRARALLNYILTYVEKSTSPRKRKEKVQKIMKKILLMEFSPRSRASSVIKRAINEVEKEEK